MKRTDTATGLEQVLEEEPAFADLVAALAVAGEAPAFPSVEPAVRCVLERRAAVYRRWVRIGAAAAACAAVAWVLSSGGAAAPEGAVVSSLAAAQRADGRWIPERGGEAFSVEATALGVLRLLDETAPEATEARDRAVQWLVARQGADGSFGGTGVRGLALPTVALLRVYEREGKPELRDVLDGAVCAVRERLAAEGAAPTASARERAWLAGALALADELGWGALSENPLRKALWNLRDSTDPFVASVAAATTYADKRAALVALLGSMRELG